MSFSKFYKRLQSKRTKKDDFYHGQKNDKIIFIKLDEVSYFEADSNYTASIQQWERF
jgi:DNA-binding LytR/AlgR family response regulator